MSRVFPLVSAVLLLVCASMAEAAPGAHFDVPQVRLEDRLASLDAVCGPLSFIEGEIVQAGDWRCVLRHGDELESYRVSDGCLVLVNGSPAPLEAARPVTPDAFFWAGCWLDCRGCPRVIEAVYCGGELSVVAVSPGRLVGLSPETRDLYVFEPADSWLLRDLEPGDSIYVLLDLAGRIRWLRRF